MSVAPLYQRRGSTSLDMHTYPCNGLCVCHLLLGELRSCRCQERPNHKSSANFRQFSFYCEAFIDHHLVAILQQVNDAWVACDGIVWHSSGLEVRHETHRSWWRNPNKPFQFGRRIVMAVELGVQFQAIRALYVQLDAIQNDASRNIPILEYSCRAWIHCMSAWPHWHRSKHTIQIIYPRQHNPWNGRCWDAVHVC